MLRTLIAFLHIISFSFIFSTDVSELKKEDFKAEISTPITIEKGSEGIVEINFTVGNVKGFAKLTDNLPSGVIAEAVDIGDATFTFNNGVLKIIWLNFPTDKIFTVKYKLKVDQSAPNNIEVGGKFSYLENNEKRSYSVFKKSIATGGEALAAQNTPEQKEQKVDSYAKVIRTVDPLGGDKYNVTLDITKQGIEGFCKIQEFTSFGGKMTEGDLNGAIFSFIKNKGKFVWMSLPKEENFKVSYTLDLGSAKDKDISILKGDFSFLEGNVTKKVDIVNLGNEALAENTSNSPATNQEEEKSTSESNSSDTKPTPTPTTAPPVVEKEDEIAMTNEVKENEDESISNEDSANESNKDDETEESIMDEALADNSIEETPTKQEDVEETPVLENIEPEIQEEEEVIAKENNVLAAVEEEKTTPVQEEKEIIKETKPKPVLDNNFGIQSGVNYRVQIAAGKNVVDKAYFEKRHQWTNDFVIENHNGWVKYTTGSYQVYRDARDNRETVNAGQHKFNGPFVTAYNEGIRITVQEALMVSKQKWFK